MMNHLRFCLKDPVDSCPWVWVFGSVCESAVVACCGWNSLESKAGFREPKDVC